MYNHPNYSKVNLGRMDAITHISLGFKAEPKTRKRRKGETKNEKKEREGL